MLCLGFSAAAGGRELDALDSACALEMIHAFSLIHDDLPAIDNDDLRRGRPTCHRQFDEATAILAGDALFALAFEVMAQSGNALIIQEAARAALRLVRGEMQDVISEGEVISANLLEFIHRNKTGALISASCVIGVLHQTSESAQVDAARRYGENVGLAFQIADDVLNVEGDPTALGKAVGTDSERQKATYPKLHGLEAAKAEAKRLSNDAQEALQAFPGPTEPLVQLAKFAVERIY
jgi:geranylgeranyl diphosphate synthase type II